MPFNNFSANKDYDDFDADILVDMDADEREEFLDAEGIDLSD